VVVDNGSKVNKGDVLIQMRNPNLEIQKKDIDGKHSAAKEQLSSALHQLTAPNSGLSTQEKARLEGELAKLRIDVESLRQQLEVVNDQVEKLIVRSPLAGQVITWDVKRTLQNRPVEMGQVLMTIAAADTDYDVELKMPERRVGHVQRFRERFKSMNPDTDLGVEFITMTNPGVTHTGRVIQVNPTAEPDEEHGNMVRIRVQPDDQTHLEARPGASVTANVHCGKAPWLWAKLHEAWEWLEANLFFGWT
jgi:multidrug resistance efflux pump